MIEKISKVEMETEEIKEQIENEEAENQQLREELIQAKKIQVETLAKTEELQAEHDSMPDLGFFKVTRDDLKKQIADLQTQLSKSMDRIELKMEQLDLHQR